MGIDSFIHTKDYEKILYRLRRHPFTFIPAILLLLVLLALPLGLYWMLTVNFTAWLASPIGLTILILFASIYYLSVILYFFTYFITFYLDVLIVTNDRLVDVDQNSLFSRVVAEVDLFQIQDATSEIKGIFPTMFNYGNVLIQTAGTVPKFSLHNIPRPHDIRQMLLDLSAEDKKYHSELVNKKE
ncbi:MAG: PH domain-containing protein [Patescibacteria group bacterium]|nr:PH domain-containing protein [Patescibacteria group bacterium]